MKIDKVAEISEFFKILSDPTRIRILKTLISQGEMCVNEIAERVKMSHSATSHQLSKLEARDVVLCERKSRTMCYKIKENAKTKIIRKIMLSMF